MLIFVLCAYIIRPIKPKYHFYPLSSIISIADDRGVFLAKYLGALPTLLFPFPPLPAGRVTTLWVKRPLSVSQQGRLSLPSLWGRLNE